MGVADHVQILVVRKIHGLFGLLLEAVVATQRSDDENIEQNQTKELFHKHSVHFRLPIESKDFWEKRTQPPRVSLVFNFCTKIFIHNLSRKLGKNLHEGVSRLSCADGKQEHTIRTGWPSNESQSIEDFSFMSLPPPFPAANPALLATV
jgi:hypothetical protein